MFFFLFFTRVSSILFFTLHRRAFCFVIRFGCERAPQFLESPPLFSFSFPAFPLSPFPNPPLLFLFLSLLSFHVFFFYLPSSTYSFGLLFPLVFFKPIPFVLYLFFSLAFFSPLLPCYFSFALSPVLFSFWPFSLFLSSLPPALRLVLLLSPFSFLSNLPLSFFPSPTSPFTSVLFSLCGHQVALLASILSFRRMTLRVKEACCA